MKIFRYVLIALAALLAVALAVVGYIAATFDPNEYKPEIVRLVKEQKQRTLTLGGDIRLTVFPNLGADLGRVALSEHKSEKAFASVERGRVSLALLPLLRGELVVNEVDIQGLKATVIRHKDGTLNIDDLLSKEEKKQEQFRFDIAGVKVSDTSVRFVDEGPRRDFEISKLSLSTGRIANDVPSKIDLAFTLKGNEPKVGVEGRLRGTVRFNLDRQDYGAEGLALELKGYAAGITDLSASISGGLAANLQAGEVKADGLIGKFAGAMGSDRVEATLEAPKLSTAGGKATGEKLKLVARVTRPGGGGGATLEIPAIEGTAEAVKVAAMNLAFDWKQGDLAAQGKLASPLDANLKARSLSLPQLALALAATGPNLPGKSVTAEFKGSAAVDAGKERAETQFAGKLADSQIKAKLGASGFAKPALTFDIDIDQIDVDRYLPPKSDKEAKKPEQPMDLSALKGLNAQGAIRIGTLKVANIRSTDVKLQIRASGGKLDVNPLSASLYQGTLAGSLAVNAAEPPAFAAKQTLSGISIGPLLKDVADFDRLEGRGRVDMDLTARGATVSQLEKGLNGTAGVRLADGAVKGINIGAVLRQAKDVAGTLKGRQVQRSNAAEKTDFSEFVANFDIRDGIARNHDLSLKSPAVRVAGEGEVNLPADTLNYLVKASLVATSGGQGGKDLSQARGVTVPIRVSGPLAAPDYTLDFGAMATEAAKEAVRTKGEDALGKGLEKLFRK